jgi:membrane protein
MSEGRIRREANEVEAEVEERIDGMRALAERIAGSLGGHPGVARLRAVMSTYDRAGGSLVAGGLAYTSLLALLPAFLLALSVVGLVVSEPNIQQQIVEAVAQALPPFEELAKLALTGVGSGALSSGIVAIATLLWGASRFYANLDTAFSRIFRGAPRRNAVVQTIRGMALTIILVLVPVALLTLGSVVSWLTQLAPEGVSVGTAPSLVLQLASPVMTLVAFVAVVALCYRLVPTERIAWRVIRRPAGAVGLVLAVFAQIYVLIAPRLMGLWAVTGTALALIALLAWLSIAFNVLLLGAAWTEVRSRPSPAAGDAAEEPSAPDQEAGRGD